MNALENWCCSTSFWRWMTSARLLPWILDQSQLGEHLLEIGAGAGAATAELRKRVTRVTSLEYDHVLAVRLSQRNGWGAGLLQGDSAALPFADHTFSSAIAVLVLHHLRSNELQDRSFAEAHRVLRPGGQLIGFEISDGWFSRAIHTNSTFVPVQPAALPERLTRAGFEEISVDSRRGAFVFRAAKFD
jgi:SAM-dependent methyltransferase